MTSVCCTVGSVCRGLLGVELNLCRCCTLSAIYGLREASGVSCVPCVFSSCFLYRASRISFMASCNLTGLPHACSFAGLTVGPTALSGTRKACSLRETAADHVLCVAIMCCSIPYQRTQTSHNTTHRVVSRLTCSWLLCATKHPCVRTGFSLVMCVGMCVGMPVIH
jgi:hypothetical protein